MVNRPCRPVARSIRENLFLLLQDNLTQSLSSLSDDREAEIKLQVIMRHCQEQLAAMTELIISLQIDSDLLCIYLDDDKLAATQRHHQWVLIAET